MRRRVVGSLVMALAVVAGCNDDPTVVDLGPPEPRALEASYYAGVVTVGWELAPDWDGETFRVYSRRVSDADFYLIAEVTSCAGGVCAYVDRNVTAGQTYEYYVAAVDPDTGVETPTDDTIRVQVPQRTPPPVPNGVQGIALDGGVFLTWGDNARNAQDFSHYRVFFVEDDGSEFFLGETDSEGFLDQRVDNGVSYQYFVTAVDVDGHESVGSTLATATPRPDYHGEWIYDHFSVPGAAGFRFTENEADDPIVSGNALDRHFRLEVDVDGWWLVPNAGTNTAVHPTGFVTTALRCGVGADFDCVDVATAPTSGYVNTDLALTSQTSYVLRVTGDDGFTHYGVIRVVLLGYDQNDDPIMIFDWAYQLQPGNRQLVAAAGG